MLVSILDPIPPGMYVCGRREIPPIDPGDKLEFRADPIEITQRDDTWIKFIPATIIFIPAWEMFLSPEELGIAQDGGGVFHICREYGWQGPPTREQDEALEAILDAL